MLTDEPTGPTPTPADARAGTDLRELSEAELPLAAMAVGAEVGTLVHLALEAADFRAADLAGELAAGLRSGGTRTPVNLGCEVEVAAAGLAAALATPLPAPLAGLRLCEVSRADRLDELAFELPLAGGERPVGQVGLRELAGMLARHLGPDDPLAAYPERLLDPQLRGGLRGFLTGSIDLVVRTAGARFAILDYKTNWLAASDEPLRAWHYRPAALAEEMMRSHYALQALLYCVALHRYLRWRLPGYDPEANLAGVAYLFLRGMAGVEAPSADAGRCGVFGWRAPSALVVELSELLDRGSAR